MILTVDNTFPILVNVFNDNGEILDDVISVDLDTGEVVCFDRNSRYPYESDELPTYTLKLKTPVRVFDEAYNWIRDELTLTTLKKFYALGRKLDDQYESYCRKVQCKRAVTSLISCEPQLKALQDEYDRIMGFLYESPKPTNRWLEWLIDGLVLAGLWKRGGNLGKQKPGIFDR